MPSNARILEILAALPPAKEPATAVRQRELLDACVSARGAIPFKHAVFATRELFGAVPDVDQIFVGDPENDSFLTAGDQSAHLIAIQNVAIFKRAMFSLETADEAILKAIVAAGVTDAAVGVVPNPKIAVVTILANNLAFGNFGADKYSPDRLTEDQRAAIATRAQVVLDQRDLDKKLGVCVQKFENAEHTLEAKLGVIEDDDLDVQALAGRADVIDEALTQLKELEQQLIEIDKLLPRPARAVNPAGGVAVRVDRAAPQTLNTEIERKIEAYKQRVQAQADKLVEVAQIKLDSVIAQRTDNEPEQRPHAQLLAAVAIAERDVASISKTLELMNESDCPNLNGIQAIYDAAQLALVQLQIRSASQLAKKPLAVPPPPAPQGGQLAPVPPVLLGNPGAQSALDELDEIKVALDNTPVLAANFDRAAQLTRANELIKEIKKNIQQAQNEIAAAKSKIPKTTNLTAEDDARVAELQTQLDKAIADHAAIKNRLHPHKKGNAFIAKNDSLDQQFAVELIKAAQQQAAQLPAAAKPPLALAANPNVPVVYQTVQLEKGDTIRAVAVFTPPPPQAAPQQPLAPIVRGILEQNHEGKVTDKTDPVEYDRLSDEQKSLMALKQAKMVLDNYEPGRTKEIVLSGGEDNLDKANRVYAALLYLKRENPKLDGIAIISRVNGCELPKHPLKPDFMIRNQFIHDHFSKHLIQDKTNQAMVPVDRKQMLQDVVSDVGKVVEKRDNRQADYKARYNAATNPADRAAVDQKFSRPEGSEVNINDIDNKPAP